MPSGFDLHIVPEGPAADVVGSTAVAAAAPVLGRNRLAPAASGGAVGRTAHSGNKPRPGQIRVRMLVRMRTVAAAGWRTPRRAVMVVVLGIVRTTGGYQRRGCSRRMIDDI